MTEIDFKANQLLNALTRSAPGPWQNELKMVNLPLGKVLHEPNMTRSDMYFPIGAVVSLLYVLADGKTAEVAVIGHEGVVGVSLFTGDGVTPSRAVVQCAGSAIRLSAATLNKEFVRAGHVALLLLRFTQALIAQMSQTAVCNRHHSVDQQLCRWLLLLLDRHPGHEVVMTQELIAAMLGVRRASVSESAAKLQAEGVITYARGRIDVLDRPAMEQRVCECYGVVKAEYERLLPALDQAADTQGPHGMRHDASRLSYLRESGILNTPSEAFYDNIARRATQIFDAPIGMVSFLDEGRDWFKSCVGFVASESPAETSFCDVFFTMADPTVIVENALLDPRFSEHPFVRGMPFIRFYAAVRLEADGHTIGTLCVYDVKEQRPHIHQVRALQSLASAVVNEIKSGAGNLNSS